MKSTIPALAALLFPALALAHISIASGPGIANATQDVAFGVGHGCAGSDTYSVRIVLPAGITSVRPMNSDFGRFSVETNAAGDVTAVTWQKTDADLYSADIAFYKLVIRMKLPNTPFTTLYFPTYQTCKGGDGGISSTDWVGTPDSPTDAGVIEPAPALVVVPAHKPGWNKYVAPAAISTLSAYFGDAAIVWKGTAAYSANPAVADLIKTTSGVTPLTAIAANDEIWVKY